MILLCPKSTPFAGGPMRRSLLIRLLLLLSLTSLGSAKRISIHGFVTAVHSPTSFEIDNYKVTDETAAYAKLKNERAVTLKPGMLRVGLEVEVKGDYERNTGELKAHEIKAVEEGNVESTGLIEKKLSLTKDQNGWSGSLLADGETLQITPETEVKVRRSRSERKEMKNSGRETDEGAFSPDDIGMDTFAHYQGTRKDDHSIRLSKVEFQQDRVAAESAYEWTKVEAVHVVYPDPKKPEIGTLTIGEREYPLFPSPEASVYLTQLGRGLIPAHQRDLPEDSPAKVKFKFFLVDTDTVASGVFPNGAVVVSAHVFDVLQNEAQLAFMLSHDMARAAEKQDWALGQMHRGERRAIGLAGWAAFGLPGLGLSSAFADKSVEREFAHVFANQADRIGLQYMLAAGYDPREAPETWRAIADMHADKGEVLFWQNHDQNLVRRSYLKSELTIHYGQTDFSSLKRDSKDFHDAVDAIKAERARAKKRK
jgi:hypothetical protein